MKESVSALFVSGEEIFLIKRQDFLSVFPGYHAIPGGKVDDNEEALEFKNSIWPQNFRGQILAALKREVQEEIGIDLFLEIARGTVLSINYLGTAITPDFNPYRFKNYYFKIDLKNKLNFNCDKNEVSYGRWATPNEFLSEYLAGKMLAVPPMVLILYALQKNLRPLESLDLNYNYDSTLEVPMIQSVYGVRQFLPLSNTFPPANRTNAFIIGDEGENKILVDPSPKDEFELRKLCTSLEKIGFTQILITHHHPDHYQFSRELAERYQVPLLMSKYTYDAIGPHYFSGLEVELKREGDIVTRSLGEDVLVYEIPGHDEGQLGLAPKSLNWFLVGDLIQTIGTVVIGAPEGDMKKYFLSLQRIIELEPQFIIPSHGIIIGGVNKLKETLKHRQDREDQIALLHKEGKTVDEMVQIIYGGIDPKLHPYGKKTILAHLQKLCF